MFSYWEQQSFTFYDHIVVGAGIVGLSAAIEIATAYPGASVLILERGLLPVGASTRNAGFACMGSASELLDDLQNGDEREVVALFAERKRGLEMLRSRLGDARLGYEASGSHELISHTDKAVLDKLDYLNTLLLPVSGKPAFRHAPEKLLDFGFATESVATLVENTCEGALNTGKMMRALVDTALDNRVEIKTGCMVRSFNEEAGYVSVIVGDPHRGVFLFRCSTLSICTNAFTKELLPAEDVIPGRGQVLVTAPVPGLKLKGIFHFDKGYYYFREIEGRVLFGGGRNLDFAGEQTTDLGLNEKIQTDLEEKLANIILPGSTVAVDYRWAGIMAFGNTKQPVVKAFGKRVFGAFRMGGMGVALGTEVASRLAGMVAQYRD